MSRQLYACVHAAEFPAQALLRLRPELRGKPISVLEGRAPLEAVCSINSLARQKGAVLGLSRVEAEAIDGLQLVSRSLDGEASARDVLIECAASFSPRIEDASAGTHCVCVLDISGTDRLFGPPETLARRLRSALANAGFHASIAISANFHTAVLKAASTRGVIVIPSGEEALVLSKLPMELLHLPEQHAETLTIWGIRTLGELAALPAVELIARIGQQAGVWRAMALGIASHTLQPVEPRFLLEEFCEIDTPVDQVESLLFLSARMIDCLASRAASRALSLALLTVTMTLEGGRMHRCVIRPALPSTDRKFLLKLVSLEIAAHPPPSAVVALAIHADAGQSSKMQLGLFAPQTPEPSRLDVTIARLKAIAGEDRVGSPVLEDIHRSGNFRMEGFSVSTESAEQGGSSIRIALRRMRPAQPIRVVMHADAPAIFHDGRSSYRVTTAFGPWCSSGCWWSLTGWDEEEWDVLAQTQEHSQIACLLVRDRGAGAWRLEAYYD